MLPSTMGSSASSRSPGTTAKRCARLANVETSSGAGLECRLSAKTRQNQILGREWPGIRRADDPVISERAGVRFAYLLEPRELLAQGWGVRGRRPCTLDTV